MALSSELSALSARIVNKLPRPALVLLGSLYSTLSRIYQVPGARLVSKLLVAFGVLYGINKKLNSSALRVQGASRPWKWHQEVVLVTGGSSGIGAVMVRKFAQQKIKVAIIDINPPQDPLPPGVKYYNADVTSPEAVHDAAERIRSELGAPTVLINNAGIGTGETILSTTPELIQRTFGINIVSHFWTVREFLPAMIEQKHGHIVTIASMASFVTIAGNVDYSCTKAGALAFHEGLAQELQHRYNAPHIRTT